MFIIFYYNHLVMHLNREYKFNYVCKMYNMIKIRYKKFFFLEHYVTDLFYVTTVPENISLARL